MPAILYIFSSHSFSSSPFLSFLHSHLPSPPLEFHARKLAGDTNASLASGSTLRAQESMSWTHEGSGMSALATAVTCTAAVGIICLIAAVGLYVWWRQRQSKDECSDPAALAEKGQSSSLAFLTQRMLSSSVMPRSPYTDKHGCGRCLPSHGVASLQIIPSIELRELELATRNFSAGNQLGEGGFATVYHGKLSNGMEVAVKRLSDSSEETVAQFQMEVELMSFLQSYYLVALLAKCEEKGELILVYELMEHGSLDTHLFEKSRGSIQLSWSMRMKIALDAARGLEYLHNLEPPLVHRDFKSSNILLDKKLNAKVSDFGGVQKLEAPSIGTGSGPLLGTFGYLAPEYIMAGMLTEKSDVYSFGVVLLELITGRKALDTSLPPKERSLVTWASPYLAKKEGMLSIIDPVLKKEGINVKHLWQAAAISQLCCQPQPEFRPLMVDVVYSLKPLVLKRLGGDLSEQNNDLPADQELLLEGPKSPPSAPSGELYELYDWRNSFKKTAPLPLTIDIEN